MDDFLPKISLRDPSTFLRLVFEEDNDEQKKGNEERIFFLPKWS